MCVNRLILTKDFGVGTDIRHSSSVFLLKRYLGSDLLSWSSMHVIQEDSRNTQRNVTENKIHNLLWPLLSQIPEHIFYKLLQAFLAFIPNGLHIPQNIQHEIIQIRDALEKFHVLSGNPKSEFRANFKPTHTKAFVLSTIWCEGKKMKPVQLLFF